AQAPSDRWPSLNAVGRTLLPFASEKVRIAMSDRFRDSGPVPVRATGSGAAATAAPGPAGPVAAGQDTASVVTAPIAPPARELPPTLVLPPAPPEPPTVSASIPHN